jgi:hypothetical protein
VEKRSEDPAGAGWMRAIVDCTWGESALLSSYVLQTAMLTALTIKRLASSPRLRRNNRLF